MKNEYFFQNTCSMVFLSAFLCPFAEDFTPQIYLRRFCMRFIFADVEKIKYFCRLFSSSSYAKPLSFLLEC